MEAHYRAFVSNRGKERHWLGEKRGMNHSVHATPTTT